MDYPARIVADSCTKWLLHNYIYQFSITNPKNGDTRLYLPWPATSQTAHLTSVIGEDMVTAPTLQISEPAQMTQGLGPSRL
jgi:hypothetical protein